MAICIPRRHVEGLRKWLGRTLHFPGTWRAPHRLDSFLAQCGFLLHPAPNGDFIFRARYSACLVKKEEANYRLEIRIFQKGVRRLEQGHRYIMKCPVETWRLSQESVHCGPTFMQVSRPLPPRSTHGQTPWLLSLRGELVASLEDASLMGLYVDINATTVTVQSPRPGLLQRREVLNSSVELLPLWLVSGYYAISLEAACPQASSQPESEVSVHIPKQRLGLVKRGSYIEESLSLTVLQVHPSGPFTVTESKDFVMVSVPAAGVLQVQQCQEAQGMPGTQAFYNVDLTLGSAETASPMLWTVENVFPCVASGMELPPAAATPKPASSLLPPGPGTPPAGMLSAAASLLQTAGPGPQWASVDTSGPEACLFGHCSSKESPSPTPTPGLATSSSKSEPSPEKTGDSERSQPTAAPLLAGGPSLQHPRVLRGNARRWEGGSAATAHTDEGLETWALAKGLAPSAPEPGLEKQPKATACPAPALDHVLQSPRSPPKAPISAAASLSTALSLKKEFEPFLHPAKLAGRSWTSSVPISPRAGQGLPGPRAPLEEVGLPGHSSSPVTLYSGSSGIGPGSLPPVSPDPTALAEHLSSGVTPPQPLLWRLEQSRASLVSGQSSTLAESLRTQRLVQEPTQSSGRPLLLGGLSRGLVAVKEPIRGQPDGGQFQPVVRSSVTSPAQEATGSCCSPGWGAAQGTPSITEPMEPPSRAWLPPQGSPRAPGHVFPDPRQDLEAPGPTLLWGRAGTFTSPGARSSEAGGPGLPGSRQSPPWPPVLSVRGPQGIRTPGRRDSWGPGRGGGVGLMLTPGPGKTSALVQTSLDGKLALGSPGLPQGTPSDGAPQPRSRSRGCVARSWGAVA
ncbi:ciliated left-right organizer ZP-N domains-containing protein isoform X2 [Tamandua tetradactyla]|uniref:ciliated left-right organizer ZP-N domains-containing protein isoform X2 n=1 Tax=Tamandua tetradactyla TaxID=48850 RepID=UPI004053B2CF